MAGRLLRIRQLLDQAALSAVYLLCYLEATARGTFMSVTGELYCLKILQFKSEWQCVQSRSGLHLNMSAMVPDTSMCKQHV